MSVEFKFPIPLQTQSARGANALAIITKDNLTEDTADTDQTLDIFTTPARDTIVDVVDTELIEEFEDESDAALNDTKLSIGDSGDPDRLLTAQQLNANGTTLARKEGAGSHTYTSATTVQALVESMTAKKLADLDKGQIHIWLNIK